MKLYPSLMCADFANMRKDVEALDKTAIEGYHMDIMDGHFVPNITLSITDIVTVQSLSKKPMDVHLMTADTDKLIELFLPLGCERICIHYEATVHHDRVIRKIKESGAKAGIAINPGTPLSVLEYLLPEIDFVLIMTVNPGFAGQDFVPYCMGKIADLAKLRSEKGLDLEIEVDGCVRSTNIQALADAGADSVVLGSVLFGGGIENYAKIANELSSVK